MKGGGGASFRGAKAFHHKVHRGFAKVAKEGQNHNLGQYRLLRTTIYLGHVDLRVALS
jgi:hypothetical protein